MNTHLPHLIWGGVKHGTVVVPRDRRIDVLLNCSDPHDFLISRVDRLPRWKRVIAKFTGLDREIDRIEKPQVAKLTYYASIFVYPVDRLRMMYAIRLMVQEPGRDQQLDGADVKWILQKFPSVVERVNTPMRTPSP